MQLGGGAGELSDNSRERVYCACSLSGWVWFGHFSLLLRDGSI